MFPSVKVPKLVTVAAVLCAIQLALTKGLANSLTKGILEGPLIGWGSDDTGSMV